MRAYSQHNTHNLERQPELEIKSKSKKDLDESGKWKLSKGGLSAGDVSKFWIQKGSCSHLVLWWSEMNPRLWWSEIEFIIIKTFQAPGTHVQSEKVAPTDHFLYS